MAAVGAASPSRCSGFAPIDGGHWLRVREDEVMTAKRKLVFGVLAGMAIGIIAAMAIHARQVRPAPAYIVAELEAITGDAANLQQYGAKVGETLAPFDHKFVIRGKPISLEGEPPKSVVMIEFDSVEKAQAWYNSRAYEAIKPLRQSSSKGRMFIVEGIPEK
jgi:uncharacterized protein (DUF1330 family)